MKKANTFIAFLPIILLIAFIFCNVYTFGDSALEGPCQISLIAISAICTAIGMLCYHIPWKDFENEFAKKIKEISTAILILLIIGALSSIWMISGIVPTLIYYGLEIIHPRFFFATTCIICALVSVVTGSSWTTIATIGIALLGIGKALGFSDAMTAGAIISGAYFGDKVSPLSDTTVFASSTVGTPLFDHIRYLMITTTPAFILTLIIFTCIGLTGTPTDSFHIHLFSEALATRFHISPWLLLVPLATGLLIARKIPSAITLFLSTLLAVAFAIIFRWDPNISWIFTFGIIVLCSMPPFDIFPDMALSNSILVKEHLVMVLDKPYNVLNIIRQIRELILYCRSNYSINITKPQGDTFGDHIKEIMLDIIINAIFSSKKNEYAAR